MKGGWVGVGEARLLVEDRVKAELIVGEDVRGDGEAWVGLRSMEGTRASLNLVFGTVNGYFAMQRALDYGHCHG